MTPASSIGEQGFTNTLEAKRKSQTPELQALQALYKTLQCDPCTEKNNYLVNRQIAWTEIPEQLISQCKKAGVEVDIHFMKDWSKNAFWFSLLVRFHFAGVDTHEYSVESLGLEGDGLYGKHSVYREVMQKIREHHGLRRVEDYLAFMNWLVCLDMITDFPCPDIFNGLTVWQKRLRAELCPFADRNDATVQVPYDPYYDPKRHNLENFCHAYPGRFSEMREYLLQAFFSSAPAQFNRTLLECWFNRGECKGIRTSLFRQCYYPLNTQLHEYYPWNTLIYALHGVLPDHKKSDVYRVFQKFNGKNEVVSPPSDITNREMSTYQERLGRTLIAREPDKTRYLKIQRLGETRDEFITGYARLKAVADQQKAIGMESGMVAPVILCKIYAPLEMVKMTGLDPEERKALLDITGMTPRLVMVFTAPADMHYEKYAYDAVDPDSSFQGLCLFAKDYGRLWMHGLLGPAVISLFHNRETGRSYDVLSPYSYYNAQGGLEAWNGKASDYPNAGQGDTGMRDMADIKLPEEFPARYFSCQNAIDFSQPENQKKVRLEELARAAFGLVILYGRCNSKWFDYEKMECIEKIRDDLSRLLSDLFSHAFSLPASSCQKLMQEDELIDQCAREVSYWLAENTPYVDDLRSSRLNRKVYPSLPDSMQACKLTDKQLRCLTDHGFAYKGETGRVCQLGAHSGRLPLIALTAIIVKMLTVGTLKLARESSGKNE